MKIVLVSRDNGVGLSTDMNLLSDLFTEAGHRVAKADWRARRIPECDVVIFLELLAPHLIRFARRSVGIFNPEWFLTRWSRTAAGLDQIWAKSKDAHHVFSQINSRTHYTGFLTRDMYLPAVPREPRVLHIQGHSQDKNTERVLEAWTKFPDLPQLTVLTQKNTAVPPWVSRLGRVPETSLKHLMNSHDIHLCPSRVEGWGHYITEAVSTGAYTITTDASPMNEHVTPGWGLLLPPSDVAQRGIVHTYDVQPEAIAEAVRTALDADESARSGMREAAREHTRRRNQEFRDAALHLLED